MKTWISFEVCLCRQRAKVNDLNNQYGVLKVRTHCQVFFFIRFWLLLLSSEVRLDISSPWMRPCVEVIWFWLKLSYKHVRISWPIHIWFDETPIYWWSWCYFSPLWIRNSSNASYSMQSDHWLSPNSFTIDPPMLFHGFNSANILEFK